MSLSSSRRREDRRLVSGQGTYADDVNLPGQAYAAFVRSVVPHGVLRGIVPRGLASIAWRSLLMAGSSLSLACDAAIEKGRTAAAVLLEVAETDLEFRDGTFRVAGTDRGITLLEVARRVREAPMAGGPDTIDSTGDYDAEELNFPNGCHICEGEFRPSHRGELPGAGRLSERAREPGPGDRAVHHHRLLAGLDRDCRAAGDESDGFKGLSFSPASAYRQPNVALKSVSPGASAATVRRCSPGSSPSNSV